MSSLEQNLQELTSTLKTVLISLQTHRIQIIIQSNLDQRL